MVYIYTILTTSLENLYNWKTNSKMHVSRQLYFEEVKSNMEPIIVFSTIIKKFVGKPLQIISFNFTDPAFKITALTLIAEVYSVLYTVFSVTTCIETDISQCTQSLVMGAIGAQVNMQLQ